MVYQNSGQVPNKKSFYNLFTQKFLITKNICISSKTDNIILCHFMFFSQQKNPSNGSFKRAELNISNYFYNKIMDFI